MEVLDIDSFARVSRLVRELGARHVTEHATLKKKYSSLWISLSQNPIHTEDLKRRLVLDIKDFISTPRHAAYVQRVNIMRFCEHFMSCPLAEIDRQTQTSANSELLQSIVRETLERFDIKLPTYTANSLQGLWMGRINIGSEDLLIGLLMTLLLNISAIHLETDSQDI